METDLKKEIGIRLKEFRLEKGLQVKEIASILEIAQPSWSAYESGKTSPSIENLKKIAEQGADLNYILTGNKAQKNKPYNTVGEALEALFKMPIPFETGILYDRAKLEDIKVVGTETVYTTAFYFYDLDLNELISNWIEMHKKYDDGIIDKELFDLWKAKKIEDYKDKPLLDPQDDITIE